MEQLSVGPKHRGMADSGPGRGEGAGHAVPPVRPLRLIQRRGD